MRIRGEVCSGLIFIASLACRFQRCGATMDGRIACVQVAGAVYPRFRSKDICRFPWLFFTVPNPSARAAPQPNPAFCSATYVFA